MKSKTKLKEIPKFVFSKQKHNFGDDSTTHVRLIYNDGTVVEPLKEHYKNIKRVGMKSATVVCNKKPLYTLNIKNDKLIYRMRNLAKGFAGEDLSFGFNNPKRCFILATEGKVAYVWDSEEVKEFDSFQDYEPYTSPQLTEDEK